MNAVTVTFKPSMSMGVENKFSKIRASMQLAAAVEVSAGIEAWFVDFQAAEGTWNAQHTWRQYEIFHELPMSLRYIIKCGNSSNARPVQRPYCNGIMSDQAMQDTIEGMDGGDKVWLELKAGLKGTVSAELSSGGLFGSDEDEEDGGGIGGSVSGSVAHNLILKNDGDDSLTTEAQQSVSVSVVLLQERKWMEDGSTLDILNAKTSIPILKGSADAPYWLYCPINL